jgi:hypothetical protein
MMSTRERPRTQGPTQGPDKATSWPAGAFCKGDAPGACPGVPYLDVLFTYSRPVPRAKAVRLILPPVADVPGKSGTRVRSRT